MGDTLTVIPHPEGHWVVATKGRRLAVPPLLGQALLPLQGRRAHETAVRACLVGDRQRVAPEQVEPLVCLLCGPPGKRSARFRRRALWLRFPLIPSRLAAPVAFRLGRLASWPGLAALAVLGMAGYLAPGLIPPAPAPVSVDLILPAALLFLATALWHELGHAAALAREGYPPGGIGAGLLFVLPVLFADVTALGALPRGGRARVDLAGVCFQLGAGGLLCSAGIWLPAARAAGLAALVAVAWSLLPFIRSDGYWLLCDLLGVPGLGAAAKSGRSRGFAVFLGLFRAANLAFLALVLWAVAHRLGRFAACLSGPLGAIRDRWPPSG